jgi:Divergent InlB B-repeat domain
VQNAPKYYIDCPLACIRPFDTGATVTLTATPSAGYTFVGWQVADHGQSPTAGVCPGTGTCTVTMSGAKDVVALFDGPTPQPVRQRGNLPFAANQGSDRRARHTRHERCPIR